jgi:hypothetical protein
VASNLFIVGVWTRRRLKRFVVLFFMERCLRIRAETHKKSDSDLNEPLPVTVLSRFLVAVKKLCGVRHNPRQCTWH